MKKNKTPNENELSALRELMKQEMEKRSPARSMELSVESEMRKFAQKAMDEKLASLPAEDGTPKACERCGSLAKRKAIGVSRTFKTIAGEHTILRDYYYCEKCPRGFYPRDEMLGLPEHGEVSEELARRMADFGINDPYDMCSERWNMHYAHLQVSENQFRLVMTRVASALEKSDEVILHATLKAQSNDDESDTTYIMNDGSMVPMQGGEWKEVKSALIFRDKNLTKTEEKIRGVIENARFVSVLGPQKEFRDSLEKALKLEDLPRQKHVLWLGDGAKGNWHLASTLCPYAKQILDIFHPLEKANELAKVILEKEAPYFIEAFRLRVRELLYLGQVKKCIRELLECIPYINDSALKPLNDLVRYFRNNQCRMRYDEYLKNGWLIGSGPMESTHRHVIQARMKRSGQHWSFNGGRRMARMRAAYKTAGAPRFFDSIFAARRQTTLTPSSPTPRKRYASNR